MSSFLFFPKQFKVNVYFVFNSIFGFFFFINLKKTIVLKFCVYLSFNFFMFKSMEFFLLIFPFFIKKTLSGLRNTFFRLFVDLTSLSKKRLRLSGLGFNANFVASSRILQLNVGFPKPITVSVPKHVFFVKIHSNKKKILMKGYLFSCLSTFCHKIRSYKVCDVYKHKGVRLRFEQIRTKEGKRSGKR